MPAIKIEGQAAVSNAALLIKVRGASRACALHIAVHVAKFGGFARYIKLDVSTSAELCKYVLAVVTLS